MKKTLIFGLSILSFFSLGALWADEPAAGPAADFLAESRCLGAQPAVQASPVPAGGWLFAADADVDVLAGVRCCQAAALDCAYRCRCGVAAFACVPVEQCTSTCSCAPCLTAVNT